jgi:GntR family transcriptional regulator/MocR family aminotransferase
MQKNRTNLADWSAVIPVLRNEPPSRNTLYKALRRLIEEGTLPSGSKLPPSRLLASQLNVARGAVVAAFDQLIADGFASARVGSGTYVAQAVPHVMMRAENRATSKLFDLPIIPGRMGSATVDATTFAAFRRLLVRDLRRPAAAHFHYSDPRGSLALRNAVARYLRSARGVRLHADQVMLTSGSQQALDLVLRALLTPGDTVWIEDPCYPPALELMRSNGLEVAPVPVDEEGFDTSRASRIAKHAKAVFVTPSHQYPLGVAMSMRRRLALLAWAKSSAAWIIEDDYDSEFRYAGPPLASLQGMDDAERVIYIGTLSKALFPGLRTGYVVLPDAILDQMVAFRERIDRNPPTLAEGALTAFLDDGYFAAHIRRARKRAMKARDALLAGLARGPIHATAPEQGLHLIARPPKDLSEGRALRLAAEAGLYARRLSSMYIDARPRPGLVIGFSGFAPLDFNRVAQKFSKLATHDCR